MYVYINHKGRREGSLVIILGTSFSYEEQRGALSPVCCGGVGVGAVLGETRTCNAFALPQ